ncbi:hypothetical protein BZA05DRAFT_332263 [Tricharina praecox]|uniref:uncharacterized protein n=1 Tax=Tricharina praecox TaxID=43433 RepID=UPI00222125E0|nr:uncharacterized protein BZA05DRAFT_332263 [Tricharina praecox]KAI5856815.1 hypothetical protein BZA05DRAFT_332263 [Tricharina praecox]
MPSVAGPVHAHAYILAPPHHGEHASELSPPSSGATAPIETEDYVFCDPAASRYLEDDPFVSVVHRQRELYGYEIYLVEQWACSRSHPTFVICTYTGDSSHRITISVLRIPKYEKLWSPKLSIYFEAVNLYARPKETELGTMMVTNLSSFPSALTVVHVPGGDVKSHRLDFIVNEDLKRMGCSGRSALTLTMPTDASQTKFHQLYRTSDRLHFYTAVVELVRLCQLALMAFGKLKQNSMYADGLLCDVTEKGIRDWWAEFGTEFYNAEPNDGTLGPSTVAALLGMLLGARNRLSLYGAPVPKDAFDLPALEKAVAYFQRQHRLERTGYIDRNVIERLHNSTTKSGPSSADIFAVPRAIKSTVADLSARAVGSSGSTDVTAVETMDVERFVRHISGESCKFLWQGKPRKTASFPSGGTHSTSPSRRNSVDGRPTGSLSGDDEPVTAASGMLQNFRSGTPEPSETPSVSSLSTPTGHHLMNTGSGSTFAATDTTREATVSDLRKAVFKSVSGRMKDVASGISAGADKVRGRGHQRSQTKEMCAEEETSAPVSPIINHHQQSRLFPPPASSAGSVKGDGRASTAPPSPRVAMNDAKVHQLESSATAKTASPSASLLNIGGPWNEDPSMVLSTAAGDTARSSSNKPAPTERVSSTMDRNRTRSCTRRKSFSDSQGRKRHHEAFYSGRLSFSIASEAVLNWDLPFSPPDPELLTDPLHVAGTDIAEWSGRQISRLQHSLNTLDGNMRHLNSMVENKCTVVGVAEREGRLGIDAEREKVRENIREAEVLGARMKYEMEVVQSKLLDLEESVANLAKFVHEIEAEVKILGDDDGDEGKRVKKGLFAWILGR